MLYYYIWDLIAYLNKNLVLSYFLSSYLVSKIKNLN